MQNNLTSECSLLGDKEEMEFGVQSLLKCGPCIHTYARAIIKICMVFYAVHFGFLCKKLPCVRDP